MKKLSFLILLFSPLFCLAQSIVSTEYFYDTDPGIGAGIVFNSFVPSAIADIDIDIPTTGLFTGNHVLYIRTFDTDGRWSLSEGRTINIVSAVISAEYFYDTDPGLGNATAVSAFGFSDSVNFNSTFPTTGLSVGNHVFYIRTKDADGRWSLSEGRTINIVPSIIAAEYFYDTDPGVGNATSFSAFAFSDSINFSTSFPTAGLSTGSHVLYFRTKDTDGRWSLSEGRTINIVPSIIGAEYFYDTDPGVGNATSFSAFAFSDSINFSTSFPITGLSTGIHVLYFRTKDTDGRWSLSEGRTINIVPSIIGAEYFYDTDPGVGNATAVTTFSFSDSINFSTSFPTAGLSTGSHVLYVRTKDTDGRWSLSEALTINIVPSIIAAEYFFDTDPGVGNATAVTTFSFSDSINFSTFFPTTALSTGSHVLYVRTKDTDGRWSLSEGRTINIISSIIAAEYFYDTDPGVGLASSIPGTFGSDSANFNYLFPTNHLSTGSHLLYVRTKDSDNRWSLSEPRNFTLTNDSAILVRLFIEGFYIGNRQMTAVINAAGEPTICDQLRISLVESIPPYNIFYTQNTFVMTDGIATVTLPPGAYGNSYYFKMQHRNSIETWSALPVLINDPIVNYSFTNAVTKAYGNNMKDLGDGNFADYSGDISDASTATTGVQDGVIESQDYSDMENAIGIVLTGYVPEDITGDGVVESLDYSIMENNVSAVISSMHP